MSIRGNSSELHPTAEGIGVRTRFQNILDGPLLWYLFVAPAVLLIAVFMVVPIVQSLSLALYRWNGIRPMEYVGLDNLVDLWSDRFFLGALQHTFVFAIVATAGTVGVGLLLAVAISRGAGGHASTGCCSSCRSWSRSPSSARCGCASWSRTSGP